MSFVDIYEVSFPIMRFSFLIWKVNLEYDGTRPSLPSAAHKLLGVHTCTYCMCGLHTHLSSICEVNLFTFSATPVRWREEEIKWFRNAILSREHCINIPNTLSVKNMASFLSQDYLPCYQHVDDGVND